MSNFIKEFKDRGFFYQSTNTENLESLMNNGPIVAYGGFDATASSLHVGNLILIMILRLLQKHGHKPLVLVGGGTTKIGDPSGRDETRKILSDNDIDFNIERIKIQLSKFIDFDNCSNKAILVNNADWLDKLNYSEFLRDYGRHFSINRMLSFDSVKLRLEREQNLSFLEFNYMLLQAYDFTVLNKNYNCRLQVGGSDQWGNIVNGVELGKKLKQDELFGLTNPLLTTSTGAKMGKSVSGALWLDKDLLSVYEYYQYWRNCEDNDVIKFMKLFTDLELKEIDKFSYLKGSEINEAKKILAFEATKICHGIENAKIAESSSISMFENNIIDENLPVFYLSKEDLDKNIPAYEILRLSNIVDSASEARRLIRGKGVRINDILIEEEMSLFNSDNLINQAMKISVGKKKHIILKLK